MAFVSVEHGSTIVSHTRFVDKIKAVLGIIYQYRTYKKTVRELEALSQHELEDLGLGRSMISLVAYNSVYGK